MTTNRRYGQKLVINARMINTSGIGRYIQALIPALIEHYSEVTLLGNIEIISKFEWVSKVNIVELNDPIYSITEQINMLRKTPACDIFLSPHYNVPIFLPQAKNIAVIIPDTNHLVFKNDLSLMKRAYANIFFNIAVKKDIIFTISEFSKTEIIKYTNCDPHKIIVGTLAIDKEHFQLLDDQLKLEELADLKKYKCAKFILYIGNVKPHKNLNRALLAFKKVARNIPELQFLIVGKKDNFLTGDTQVVKLVEEDESLKTKVIFTGHISDLHLAYLYKNATLFLFPSLYEGFGLPPLEAMFFGCPVIVSKEGSLPEICGDAAYYCDAYDVDNIASSITKVLTDSEVSESLISKGRVKVNEYDWSNFAGKVLQGLATL